MKILITQLFVISVFTLALPLSYAEAAEAIMPVKARIIRCVTETEKQNMCMTENLCCSLIDKMPDAKAGVDKSTETGQDLSRQSRSRNPQPNL